MSPILKPPVSARVGDSTADRVLRNHDQRIRELQSLPIVNGILIKGIELTSATPTPVPHKLGRVASVFVSPPLNPTGTGGRIKEIRSSDYDPVSFIVLQQDGFGPSVIVDAWCF